MKLSTFQMFPQEEGFPFPKYHGACGRFVIEEYMGVPLQDFYNAPWLERVQALLFYFFESI